MKKYYVIALLFSIQAQMLAGQKYFSKAGNIHFVSESPLEKIEATNSSALVVLDASTGQMEWSVLIKGFQFAKDLMQEHFNENYMESHKYPKGLFKGAITNMHEVNLKKDGTYPVQVKGDLTLHGVTKVLITSGKIFVKGGKISASSTFDIVVADYNIVVPKVVKENIARSVKTEVNAELQLMN
jgi:flagellar basal body P-ring protein FlgI